MAENNSPYFLKVSKTPGEKYLIFQPEFPVFRCKIENNVGVRFRGCSKIHRYSTSVCDWKCKLQLAC